MMKISRPKPQGPHEQVAQLASNLLEAATQIHKVHLMVSGPGSYAAHKALNELYDALPDHADDIVEQYQGAAEILLNYPDATISKVKNTPSVIGLIRQLTEEVNALQSVMPYSEITNQLDEVKSLLNSAKYKLLFLQ